MHTRFKIALLAAVIGVVAFGGSALATPGTQHQHQELAAIREATARFHNVDAALAAGYELGYRRNNGAQIITGCVKHPTLGAMGYHYFNKALVDNLAVDPMQPEALVYAPGPDGNLQLAAVEWVVPGPTWTDPPGAISTPTVLGMEMRILVPAVDFYTHHAWVWKHNPSGMMADWNPKVVCP
jgi:hypothetical protein